MKKLVLLFCVSFLLGCSFNNPKEFSKESLEETFLDWNQQEISFKQILEKHKGKKVLIDIWASWCKDCIVTLEDLKKLQKENPEVVYVFLSLDKTPKSWIRGVNRYKIEGDHYLMSSKKKGPLGDFLNLWWIPRYVVVNENGNIDLFKATKITDKNILKALKK